MVMNILYMLYILIFNYFNCIVFLPNPDFLLDIKVVSQKKVQNVFIVQNVCI